jgi:hypothetical protein
MNHTSSSLKAFKGGASLGLSRWYMGNLATTLAEEKDTCVFLPRFKPHAFVMRSPRLRLLTLFTPAGLEEAFRSMNSPAQTLEFPVGAPTHSTADLNQTAQRLTEYGVRLLTPGEIAEQLPLYPTPLF